ncbi:ABC transporter substrate-binding protein [Branchiibius cervicis]|uniref:ABC transporter substrate-binding protein n=1 Tax=Branchiibius cervicis TaxID=908252 RepID=A0ABW2AWP2_9MICO
MVTTTRRGVLGIVAGSGLGAILAACSNGGGSANTGGGGSSTINIGSLAYPANMDPVNAQGSNVPFFQAVYDNLIDKAPTGELKPMLATEWKWSADNKTLEMALRTDVKFSDGTAFNADAARQNLLRYRDSKLAGSTLLAQVQDVKVVDPHRLQIVLSQVSPGFVQNLWAGAGFMASPKSIAAGSALKTTPVGSGPYTMDASQTALGSKWVFKARTDYWGEKAKFDTVNITTYSSETALANGLKSGQIDAGLLQQQSSIDSVKGVSTLKMMPYPFDMISISILDHDGTIDKPLADVRVRQAMNYAINRENLVKYVWQGNATATSIPVSPDSPAYVASLKDYYEHDPAKAKQLLSEAGYPNGFAITMPQYTPIATDAIANSVGEDLAAIGIKVTWKKIDNNGLYADVVTNKKYSTIIFSLGLSDSAWDMVNSVLNPLVGIGQYDDPKGLALIDQIRAAKTEAERKPLYQAFATHLVESAWSVPMTIPNYQFVIDQKVTAQRQAGMAVPSLPNYAPAK